MGHGDEENQQDQPDATGRAVGVGKGHKAAALLKRN